MKHCLKDIEMTQLLGPDAEFARPIDETLILPVGESTRPMPPYEQWAPQVRSCDASAETAEIRIPQTIAVVDPQDPAYDPSLTQEILGYDPGGYPPVPPPPPPPPNPSWNERFDELPLVRRSVPYVMPEDRAEWTGPRHRRDPKWAGRLVAIGSIVAIAAAFGAGVLAGVQL